MWLPWIFAFMAVVFVVLYASPKLRKSAFIWFTYISLTGWYYFRLWEKKRARNNGTSAAASPPSTPRGSTKTLHSGDNKAANGSQRSGSSFSSSMEKSRATQRGSTRYVEEDIEDVVYFESAEKLQQQRELHSVSERSGRMSESSSSGNSGYSEDALGRLSSKSKVQQQPKSHLGIFRSLRRSHHEHHDKRRSSEASVSDPLTSSSTSEPSMTTTRRTYTGRKKPQSWAD